MFGGNLRRNFYENLRHIRIAMQPADQDSTSFSPALGQGLGLHLVKNVPRAEQCHVVAVNQSDWCRTVLPLRQR